MEAALIYVDRLTVDMMTLTGDFHEYETCLKLLFIAKFEVIIAIGMRKTFFCDATMRNLLTIYRIFRETKVVF